MVHRMNMPRCIAMIACAAAAASTAQVRAQQAPAPSATVQNAAASDNTVVTKPTDSPPTEQSDQTTVKLSPFEVHEDTSGYYSGNTMSGTRVNSKLEDLGSSISIVTKQQMEDFGMLDINDIFLYTNDAMGTGTFTDYSVDRNGSVSDNVQLNPTQANRVRGISAANISFGNFETTARVPIDPLIIDTAEVSRGPNASVFGLGNTGGTVNMVPAMPLLNRDFTRVQSRVDALGGYRESLDDSFVLIPNKLAVRGSAAFQHDAFVRKPSGQNTIRYNGMIKFSPTKYTTITGALYWFRQDGNRPNFSPPRDDVSYWAQSGKPTWDPVAMVVHVNGQTLGPYTAATYNGPDYFNNTFTGQNHSYVFIGPGGIGYWSANSTYSNTAGPTSGGQSDHYLATSPAAGTNLGKFTNQPLFSTTPSVHDKSLYDWTKYNLSSMNYDMDNSLISTATIDQVIFTNPFNTLTAQLAVFREDDQRYQRNLTGTANDNGQSGQLYVDINEKNLDGTPNPYFLHDYIGTDQPRTISAPAKWDTYRAQAAYQVDFKESKLPDWLKFVLGNSTFSGYDDYKYRINRQYSFKDTFTNNISWIPAGTPRGNQGAITNGPPASPNITRQYFRFYVGGPDSNVDYSPSNYSYGNYTYVWGNSATGVFNHETDTLGQVAVTDATGGANNIRTVIKTLGGVWQGHMLDGIVVPTFGLREDKVYTKFGFTPQQLNADGTTFNYADINGWQVGDYRFNSGRTTQEGGVVYPFKDWSAVTTGIRSGGGDLREWMGEAVQSFGVFFNKADSFIPQAPAQDILGNILGNSTGLGKEWGVEFTTMGGKVHIRFNHFDDINKNSRQSDASTLTTRVTRLDTNVSGDALNLNSQATAWVQTLNPTFSTAQVAAEVAKETGLSTDQVNAFLAPNPPLAATADLESKGNELEINFNPTRNLTLQASGSQSIVINSNVSQALQTWINQRMPIWTTIVDPRTNTLWWNTNYGGSQTPAQNFASFVQAPYDIINQLNGKTNPQYPQWSGRVSANYRLRDMFQSNPILRNLGINGSLRYQSRAAIGYYGAQQLPAVITTLNASTPIWGEKNYYHLDLGASYFTNMFTDRIRARFQILCRDAFEPGHLQPIGAYPDGTPNTYRIVDPRQWIFQATFDL